jgi:hypothetical protein
MMPPLVTPSNATHTPGDFSVAAIRCESCHRALYGPFKNTTEADSAAKSYGWSIVTDPDGSHQMFCEYHKATN